MIEDDSPFDGDAVPGALEASDDAQNESPKKPLSAADAVNWLRYLAKCKQRLAQVSSGEKESALTFQAHVMREAARHIEDLSQG